MRARHPTFRLLGRAALPAALVLVAVLAALPLAHDDLFQHLVTGERIAATGRVPTTDFLSHTRAGAPWVSHEWGFALLVHGVHRLGGLPALLVLKVALALALALAVAAAARRLAGGAAAAGLPLAALLATLAAWAVSRELILRAALPGAVLLAVAAWGLLAFRRRRRWSVALALAAVFLVWANLHSGVVFGLFLLALFTLEAVWRGWRRRDPAARRSAASWTGLAAVCAAVVLLNPNGPAALLYPLRLARLLGDPESGFTAGHFAGGWPGPEKLLGVLLVAALAGWLALSRAGRQPGWLPLPWIAAAAVFAVLSWRSSRLALELLVLLVPAVYALWSRWAAGRPAGWGKTRPVLAASGLTLCLVLAAGVLAARPPGVVSAHFPAAAATWLEAHPPPGRMFNHQNWGGYLRWRLGEPVFWDGRNLVFAPLVREVGEVPFHQLAERYDVGYLVLSPREAIQLAPELRSGRWTLAYSDPEAAVYVARRRRPG